MIQQAVILCGGQGTRLGDTLRYCPAVEVPKPLLEVGGKPFVSYSIRWMLGIGFTEVILLVLHLKDTFDILKGPKVKLVESSPDINEAVLGIPGLRPLFLLLNGDCYPVMDWRGFCDTDKPRIAVKSVGRDAGIAIVSREDLHSGDIDCSNIGELVGLYENYAIEGGLHIGTVQGLQRAKQYMDIVVYGQ